MMDYGEESRMEMRLEIGQRQTINRAKPHHVLPSCQALSQARHECNTGSLARQIRLSHHVSLLQVDERPGFRYKGFRVYRVGTDGPCHQGVM